MHLLSIFDNLDVLKILGFGLSGLSLLLMVLAYQLLKQLITTPNPNPAVISLVKLFLGSNILILVVVGLFSIPIASNNSKLDKEVVGLSNQNQQIVTEVAVMKKLYEANNVNTIAQFNSNIAEAKEQADSLKLLATTTNNEELQKQVNLLIADLENTVITETLSSDSSTISLNSLNKAKLNLHQIQNKLFTKDLLKTAQ